MNWVAVIYAVAYRRFSRGCERYLLLFYAAVIISFMFSPRTDAAENHAPPEQNEVPHRQETGPVDVRPGEHSFRGADVGAHALMGGALVAGTTAAVYGSLTLKRNRDFEFSEYLDATARDDALRYKYMTNIFLGVTAAFFTAALAVKIADIRSRRTARKKASIRFEFEWADGVGVKGRF